MNIWIFILIIAILILVLLLVFRRTREPIVGICAAAIGLDAPSFAKWLRMGKKKRENKEKVLALLAEKKELSNAEIREALGISDRSVTYRLK